MKKTTLPTSHVPTVSAMRRKAEDDALPTHHQELAEKDNGRSQRRLAFSTVKPERFSFFARLWKHLTDASTGSPSDGLAGDTSEGSASVAVFLSNQGSAPTEDPEDWQVDQVIVEREDRDPEEGHRRHTDTAGSRTVPSVTDGTPQELEETRSRQEEAGWGAKGQMAFNAFFRPRFEDPAIETEFLKLSWYSQKRLTFFSTVYLYINWILYLILNHSRTDYEKGVYYGGLTLVTVPLPFLIYWDWPTRRTHLFQSFLCVATWYCAFSEVIQIKQCHFFSKDNNKCYGKDFLAMIYYATGFPTLVMFSSGDRLYHAIAQLMFLALLLGLIIPDQGIFARNIVSFALYSLFIQFFHYYKEKAERRMFKLNSQLKSAYRNQQKAQIAESAANQAKRRFASYIFHEVRVPLNTAMLAFQNLQVDGAFKNRDNGEESLEVYALDSSLTMMQQVLNDVLDLQRMDAGRFENNVQPFNLHKAIRSMLRATRMATDAKHLGLVVDLDPKIDALQEDPDGDGLYVVGDVVRLQQIITNFTSNAVKFSKEGDIKVVTRMVNTVPLSLPPLPSSATEGTQEASVWSETAVDDRPDRPKPGSSHKFLTFRLEVHDTGPGIKPSDLAGSRLFKPFHQTRVGRASGEGSGLGLAIVRQIISLSDGRLGISSRKGKGAIFWFELSYRLAKPNEIATARASSAPIPSPELALAPPAMLSPPLETGYITLPSPMSLISSLVSSPSSAEVSEPPEIREEPLKALVVDDDPLTRALFTRMLERMGVDVETATNGQEYLDFVLGTNPGTSPRYFDLVCLDNSMPVLTGEDAVRQLRAAGRTADYVVGCTGNALSDQQSSFISAGADRVIAKPLLLREVKDIVATALERRAEAQKREAP